MTIISRWAAADVAAALADMDRESWDQQLALYQRMEDRERRSIIASAEGIVASDYWRDDPGHPLGAGMPTGAAHRTGSHSAAWMGRVREDPCAYCGRPRAGTVDHIVPQSRRVPGVHCWANFTAACESCNTAKASMSLLEFLGRRHGVAWPKRPRPPGQNAKLTS